MNKLKSNFAQSTIAIILVIFFFSTKTNFVKNTHFVISKNYNERINNIYGYCSPEGIGYLRHLKNTYNIQDNPKIINYEHVPENIWSILNTKNIGLVSNKIIFLNYPGSKIEYKLTKSNKDIYEFKDIEFFTQHFKSISKIKVISNTDFENEVVRIDVFTMDKSLNKEIFKSLNLEKNKQNLNLFFNDLKISERKLYFKFHNTNEITDISLTLNNKYNLNDFKIIDEFKNCYYVEKL